MDLPELHRQECLEHPLAAHLEALPAHLHSTPAVQRIQDIRDRRTEHRQDNNILLERTHQVKGRHRLSGNSTLLVQLLQDKDLQDLINIIQDSTLCHQEVMYTLRIHSRHMDPLAANISMRRIHRATHNHHKDTDLIQDRATRRKATRAMEDLEAILSLNKDIRRITVRAELRILADLIHRDLRAVLDFTKAKLVALLRADLSVHRLVILNHTEHLNLHHKEHLAVLRVCLNRARPRAVRRLQVLPRLGLRLINNSWSLRCVPLVLFSTVSFTLVSCM